MACNGGATFKQQAGPAAALVARPGAAAAGTIQRKACQVAHCAVCSPPWVCRQCQPGFMRSTRGTQVRTGWELPAGQRGHASHAVVLPAARVAECSQAVDPLLRRAPAPCSAVPSPLPSLWRGADAHTHPRSSSSPFLRFSIHICRTCFHPALLRCIG